MRKQPRRGAASTKTNSERTRIDQKTTRMRYIQVQKEPGRSANNPEEVLQVTRQDQKEPGLIKKEPRQGAARTKTRSERTRIEGKQPR